jgi:hypothetical protein
MEPTNNELKPLSQNKPFLLLSRHLTNTVRKYKIKGNQERNLSQATQLIFYSLESPNRIQMYDLNTLPHSRIFRFHFESGNSFLWGMSLHLYYEPKFLLTVCQSSFPEAGRKDNLSKVKSYRYIVIVVILINHAF